MIELPNESRRYDIDLLRVFAFSLLIHEFIIRRSRILRPLFGLK